MPTAELRAIRAAPCARAHAETGNGARGAVSKLAAGMIGGVGGFARFDLLLGRSKFARRRRGGYSTLKVKVGLLGRNLSW